MKYLLITSLLTAFASVARAEVPRPVIDECHEVNAESYGNMPECLKEGTVAYEMLGLVLHDDYYGPSAQRVVDGCRERNDTFEKVWICFRTAARRAAETRQMIGIENMKDACYAAISNPTVYERIKAQNVKSRREHVGEKRFYSGGGLYRAFKGCPSKDREKADNANAPRDDKGDGLSKQACSTYKEFEGVLASHGAAELVAIFAVAETLPEEERLKSFSKLGVSQASIDFVQSADDQEAIGTGFILAALINKHHPDLLKRFMEIGETSSNPALNNLGDQIITGLLQIALEGYEKQCSK